MTSINLRYTGVHMQLAYDILTQLGYTEQDLSSINFHRPLLTLSSPETYQALYEFLISENVYSKLYQVLIDHKVRGFQYVLQCFCEAVSDKVGCLYRDVSHEEMQKVWDLSGEIIIPKLGEVLIMIEYH